MFRDPLIFLDSRSRGDRDVDQIAACGQRFLSASCVGAGLPPPAQTPCHAPTALHRPPPGVACGVRRPPRARPHARVKATTARLLWPSRQPPRRATIQLREGGPSSARRTCPDTPSTRRDAASLATASQPALAPSPVAPPCGQSPHLGCAARAERQRARARTSSPPRGGQPHSWEASCSSSTSRMRAMCCLRHGTAHLASRR